MNRLLGQDDTQLYAIYLSISKSVSWLKRSDSASQIKRTIFQPPLIPYLIWAMPEDEKRLLNRPATANTRISYHKAAFLILILISIKNSQQVFAKPRFSERWRRTSSSRDFRDRWRGKKWFASLDIDMQVDQSKNRGTSQSRHSESYHKPTRKLQILHDPSAHWLRTIQMLYFSTYNMC